MVDLSTRTQAFLLLLFGAALLRLATTDMLLRFVRDSARPWVLIAGAVLVVLAIWSLVVGARHDRAHVDDPADEHADEHGHAGPSKAAWLLVAPVIAVLVIGPPALGAYTANRQSPNLSRAGSDLLDPLPTAGTANMKVFDFALRSVTDDARSLRGRTVALEGFVARTTPDGFVLARLAITCCAADALPVEVRIVSADRPRTDAWLQVSGVYRSQDPGDPELPVLEASGVRAIGVPANPYD